MLISPGRMIARRRVGTRVRLGDVVGAVLIGVVGSGGCRDSGPTHVVELAVLAVPNRSTVEPILQEYERRTGITIRVVYEPNAGRATTLARQSATDDNARFDVLWVDEPGLALRLKYDGILGSFRPVSSQGIPERFKDVDGHWTGFAARLRVLVYHRNRVAPDDVPRSVLDLADPRWKGQIAIADPCVGPVVLHFAALYGELGDAAADEFVRGLKTNEIRFLGTDRAVLDAIAGGQIAVGLTNSDVVSTAVEAEEPIAMRLPDVNGMGVLMIPSVIALASRAPHPAEGKRLIEYLVSPDAEQRLAVSVGAHMPLHPGVGSPRAFPALGSFKVMPIDYARTASRIQRVRGRLNALMGPVHRSSRDAGEPDGCWEPG